MTPESARLLRECAVDLVRASDLGDDMALFRIGTVMNELREIQAALDDSMLPAALLKLKLEMVA